MGESSRQAKTEEITCPKCNVGKLYRVERKGFMEESMYSKFGFYPWECSGCRKRVRMKARGTKVRKRRSSSSNAAVTQSSPQETA